MGHKKRKPWYWWFMSPFDQEKWLEKHDGKDDEDDEDEDEAEEKVGGDTWEEGHAFRQGQYGFHWTQTGKVVYKRERRRWTAADLKRVSRTVTNDLPGLITSKNTPVTIIDYLIDTAVQIITGVYALGSFVGWDGNPFDFLQDVANLLTWWKANREYGKKWAALMPQAWAAFWGVINGK